MMFMLSLNPKLLQEAFPINKVEVFFDDLDHSNFLGYTWEMVSQGRFPVGLDTNDTDFNIIGKTGGEKTHKLTINEMPSHIHGGAYWAQKQGYGNINIGSTAAASRADISGIASTGGNQPHNNVPPYIVMAFWRRIA